MGIYREKNSYAGGNNRKFHCPFAPPESSRLSHVRFYDTGRGSRFSPKSRLPSSILSSLRWSQYSTRKDYLMSTTRPTPRWPSLYNILVEVNLGFENGDPVQPRGFYLVKPNGARSRSVLPRTHSCLGCLSVLRADSCIRINRITDIYRFTLYWTVVFYTPAFVLCGIYAFLNLTFPPIRHPRRSAVLLAPYTYAAVVGAAVDIPLRPYTPTPAPSFLLGKGWRRDRGRGRGQEERKKTKPNERRSRLTFALLVALTFAGCAIGGAVVGSAVMGYVMSALFKAAKYNMST